MNAEKESFDLSGYLHALSGEKVRLILCGVIACGVALALSWVLPKTYETHFTLRLGRVWFEGSQGGSYNRAILSESAPELAEIITSPAFLKGIATDLKLKGDVNTLKKRIRPIRPEHSDLERMAVFTVGVRGPTPEESLRLAEAIAERTIERHNNEYRDVLAIRKNWESDFAGQITSAESELADLKRTLAEYRRSGKTDSAMVALNVDMESRQSLVSKLREKFRQVQLENSEFMSRRSQIVSPPYRPEKPIKPDLRLNAGMGLVAGLFLYLAYIFVREAVRVGSIPRP
ncbi:MAG: hypothetical protein HYT87_18780 [Nitrospirae bacterium]|nr:hypothetical protein [Nitrospirota bacterium]